MKIYHSSKTFPKSLKNPVVALGNFDGVHRAHQKMFQLTRSLAKRLRGNAIAYSFHPHPVKVLSRASQTPMINTPEQKLELLKTTKIKAVVLEPFDIKFAELEPRDWFVKILMKRLHIKGLVAGYDFTFGKNRSGTVETLHSLCEEFGVKCEILDAQLLDHTIISSTQIRQFVQNGDVRLASELLGRDFFVDGEVSRGEGRGATLGIPTANLKVLNELIPGRGVYACRAKVGLRTHWAVTNIGLNPTFGGETLSVETHLLKFKKNIYGKKLRLFFVKKIRDERMFTSATELVDQIKKDIEAAKKILKERKR